MKIKASDVLKKYTMVIALVVVALFFQHQTGGSILLPQNINNLISQNAYVFVLAAGMLLCILTGGNIDLACGSVVCFVGGIGAVLMDAHRRTSGRSVAGLLDRICKCASLHSHAGRHVCLQRTVKRSASGICGRYQKYHLPECFRRWCRLLRTRLLPWREYQHYLSSGRSDNLRGLSCARDQKETRCKEQGI